MALFSRLLKLHKGNVPSEDFFTEIFAYLLSDNHEILYGWLKYIHVLDENTYSNAHISTQQAFDPLDHHLTGSRPDISIELVDGSNHDIIFIESKVGSHAGYKQLSRYADILEAMKKRDQIDSTRAIAPLMPALDAIIIQTDGMGINEVVKQVKSLVEEKDV